MSHSILAFGIVFVSCWRAKSDAFGEDTEARDALSSEIFALRLSQFKKFETERSMPVNSPKHSACHVINFAPGASIPWNSFQKAVYSAVFKYSNGSVEIELREEILSRTAEQVSSAFARPSFQLKGSLFSYAYTIAKNFTIRHWQLAQRRRNTAEENTERGHRAGTLYLEDLISDFPNPEERLLEADADRERCEKIRRVMESLRPSEIDALKVRYLEPRNRPLTEQERQAVRRAKARAKELAS